MWGFLLFFLLALVALSFIGALIKGLLSLAVIGAILLLAALLFGWSTRSGR